MSDEGHQYPHLAYGPRELALAMRAAYDELIDFVTTPQFKAVMRELDELPSQERPAFVLSVLVNKEQLAMRGVHVPDGILIQRSAFGDRRPTLFCVKKYLPERYSDVWQNVNITFDNEYQDKGVSRNPEICWREPLPVHLQAQIMAHGINLEEAERHPLGSKLP